MVIFKNWRCLTLINIILYNLYGLHSVLYIRAYASYKINIYVLVIPERDFLRGLF